MFFNTARQKVKKIITTFFIKKKSPLLRNLLRIYENETPGSLTSTSSIDSLKIQFKNICCLIDCYNAHFLFVTKKYNFF